MPSDRLIERGRLAYQALACKERALRYQSAAATLAEAIALAEIGDESKLKELLEAKDYLAEIQESPVAERSPAVSVLVPQADSNSKPTSNSILLGNQSGDWSSMLEGAKSRRGSSPVNEPTVSTPIKQSIAPENKNALTAIKPRPESKPIKKNQTQRRPQSTLKKNAGPKSDPPQTFFKGDTYRLWFGCLDQYGDSRSFVGGTGCMGCGKR